jgi:hypothetical protein
MADLSYAYMLLDPTTFEEHSPHMTTNAQQVQQYDTNQYETYHQNQNQQGEDASNSVSSVSSAAQNTWPTWGDNTSGGNNTDQESADVYYRRPDDNDDDDDDSFTNNFDMNSMKSAPPTGSKEDSTKQEKKKAKAEKEATLKRLEEERRLNEANARQVINSSSKNNVRDFGTAPNIGLPKFNTVVPHTSVKIPHELERNQITGVSCASGSPPELYRLQNELVQTNSGHSSSPITYGVNGVKVGTGAVIKQHKSKSSTKGASPSLLTDTASQQHSNGVRTSLSKFIIMALVILIALSIHSVIEYLFSYFTMSATWTYLRELFIRTAYSGLLFGLLTILVLFAWKG